jgi:predicted Zn-dependent protease/TPR repeat protein
MRPIQADYYDGKTSARQQVSLLVGAGKLKVIGEQVSEMFDLRRVRRSLRIANTPRWLYLPGGGACVTQDNDAVDRITRTRRYDRVLQMWESRPVLAALAVALVALSTWLLIDRALPVAADEIARRIPREAERVLGESTLQGMDRFLLQPSKLSPARQEALRAKFAALAQRAGDSTPYRLEFRASPALGANAFALPSGVIVMLDGLVKLARRDDEILGVLAHELGHVHHRHTMRRLLESSATALVIAGLTGDIASTTSLAAAAPTLLVQTKYSRDDEREADAYAVDLLQKAHVNPRYLATMLGRLETRSRRFRGGLPDFLSTHPAPEERKALALAAARQAGEFGEPEPEAVAIPDSRQLRGLDPVQREVISLVEKRDYAELERLLSLRQQRYEQDPSTEQELETAFRSFRYLGASAEPVLKEWAQQMPRSYAAHTARGVYYLWRGVEARGTAFSSETSEEQMHAMSVLLDRAELEFEHSLTLTAKPYVSHLSLITVSRYLGDPQLGDRHYRQALAIAPQSLTLRQARMTTLEPRWGGSYRQMEALAKESTAELKDAAAAAKLAARIPADRADDKQRSKNYGAALGLYDEALRLDPSAARVRCERSWVLSQLGRHGEAYAEAKRGFSEARDDSYCMERVVAAATQVRNHEETIAVATLVIDVDPGAGLAFAHRGWAKEQLGQRDAAFEDYLAGAKFGEAWAQAKVGKAYLEGAVVKRDDEEGLAWLRKSAAQGNDEAKSVLQAKGR